MAPLRALEGLAAAREASPAEGGLFREPEVLAKFRALIFSRRSRSVRGQSGSRPVFEQGGTQLRCRIFYNGGRTLKAVEYHRALDMSAKTEPPAVVD